MSITESVLTEVAKVVLIKSFLDLAEEMLVNILKVLVP